MKILLFDERNGKSKYIESNVKMKMLGSPHMVKTGPEPGSLKVSSQDVLSFARLISTRTALRL